MIPLTPSERKEANNRFHAQRCARRVFDAYWVDSMRMLVTRTVAAKRRIMAPAGGIHFGRYDAATDWATFVSDLEALLKHEAAA